MMRSIGGRLATGMLVGLLLMFVAGGTVLYWYVHRALVDQFDANLLSKARAFAATTEQGNEERGIEKTVSLSDLPLPAQEAVREHIGGGFLVEVDACRDDGLIVYKAEVVRNTGKVVFGVTAAGDYLGTYQEFEFDLGEAGLPEFQPSAKAEYYQVWDAEGNILAKSPSMKEAQSRTNQCTSHRFPHLRPHVAGWPSRACCSTIVHSSS